MDDPQRAVIAFLSTPEAYGAGAAAVDRVDTHISIVWLVGDRAYKLKRAVKFSYVDFSTVDRRREACEAEVRLNRRTAPSLYLGVRPIVRSPDGALAFGMTDLKVRTTYGSGEGDVLDWIVEMARFDQETLFDRLAARGRLDVAMMEGLADAIVQLHAGAERRPDRGGRAGMAWVIDGNAQDVDGQGAAVLDREVRRAVIAASRAALDRHGALLDLRRRDGFVRACHGDLHLRNVCLVDGRPTLFDAVEFNDAISCVDVYYDLAFLLMDLWRRGLRPHANAVLNEYLARQGDAVDLGGLPLLPLFLSCRAAVRAKTSVSAALVQTDEAASRALEAAAREYLSLAASLLDPPPPALVAVGGFSGSGKSTLARALAPDLGAAPGAIVLRSDAIRKALFHVSPGDRLPETAYAPDANRRVYDVMLQRARTTLLAGHAVVVDAVHAREADRRAVAALAAAVKVPFTGLWIDAPRNVMAARLAARGADVSDATADVLDGQIAWGTGPIAWQRLDGARGADALAADARAAL